MLSIPPLARRTDPPPYQFQEVAVAKPADAGVITALVNAAFREGDKFRRADIPRLTLEEVKEYFNMTNAKWFVVMVKKKNKHTQSIAAAILYISIDFFSARTHFLASWPKYRGYGLGQILREHCDNYARQEQKLRLTFQVASVNRELISYYETMGYRLTEQKEEYYPDALKPEWQGKVVVLNMEKIFSEESTSIAAVPSRILSLPQPGTGVASVHNY